MTSSLQLEVEMKTKKKSDRKMDLRKITMKNGRFVVFIHNDSAEIWGLGMNSHLLLAL
jgi:ribosome biogenesis protein Nip4